MMDIPFRLNNSAYEILIISFSFAVGGASCPPALRGDEASYFPPLKSLCLICVFFALEF